MTVRALLREYGTSLSDFLGDIPNVEFARGGRYGARALMCRAVPPAGAEDAADPPPRKAGDGTAAAEDAAAADGGAGASARARRYGPYSRVTSLSSPVPSAIYLVYACMIAEPAAGAI